jgi:hypothetical protein
MKVRRVFITPELIAAFLTTGCTFRGTETWVTEGLPQGAQLVGVGYSGEGRSWVFDFVHPTFDEVAEGATPPVFTVTYVRHTFERHAELSTEMRSI